MKKAYILLIALMVISVGFLSGCTTEQYSTYEGEPVNKYHRVTYKVTGVATRSVSVTFENYDGGTSQYSSVALPWERTLYSMTSGDWVYISAQNNEDGGCIETEIYVDGELFKHSQSCGAYVIATSSGILD